MIQDERLVPAGRGLDNSLADLTQAKPFGKYDRYSSPPAETNVREYLYVILKRKWLILSLVLVVTRSEEHTSELQSHLNLVCRLLLEKKKHNICHIYQLTSA